MRPETSHVGPCPDDETLAGLIEDRLPETERARLERHVARCATCLDVIAATLPASADVATPVSGVAVAVQAPAPRVGSSRWRRLAIAAGILIAATGLGLGSLTTSFGARAVGPRLATLGSRLFGVPLHVEQAALRIAGPGRVVLSLGRVSLGRSDALLAKADDLAVTVALTAPLSGEPPIERVQVTRPDVDLGAHGPAALLGSEAARARVLAAFAADRVDVVDGRIVVPGPRGEPLVVSDVDGGVVRDGRTVHVALRGRAAEGTVDLTGDVDVDGRVLRLTIGGRDLQAIGMPLFGEGMRGAMDLRLDVRAEGDTVRADGRVAVRDGALMGRGPVATLGLDAEARATLAAFDATLVGEDFAFDEARAVLAWRHGTWRLPRVFVTAREIVAGGRARIEADGGIDGQGTVRLPDDLVVALEPHVPALARFQDATGAATLPFGIGGALAAPALTLGRP